MVLLWILIIILLIICWVLTLNQAMSKHFLSFSSYNNPAVVGILEIKKLNLREAK